ncbi:hypothetical protein ES705_32749 [subsurface metagenome]
MSFACISKEFEKHIYNDGNLKVEVTERDIELGTIILYKHIVRSYRIEDLAKLREVVKDNKRRYDRDKIQHDIANNKESNGYG